MAQEGFCTTCSSYVHRYLDRCPACGTPAQSTLREELADWLAELREYPQGAGNAPRTEPYAVLLDDPAHDPPEGSIRQHLLAQWTEQFLGTLGRVPAFLQVKVKPRYLGGLAALPYQTDVEWEGEQNGWLRFGYARGRDPFLAIHASQILAITSYERDSPIGNSWYGVGFGNAITFFNPSFHGGGATITYAIGGQIGQISLGNRAGMLAAKGDPKWWRGFVEAVGIWSWFLAMGRALEIGAGPYAAELGLPTETLIDASVRQLGR